MATLVFDIETTALPLENFDEAQQEYLFRETEKLDDATAKNAKREEITRVHEPVAVHLAGRLHRHAQRRDAARPVACSSPTISRKCDESGRAGEIHSLRGRDGTARAILGRREKIRFRRHLQRPRLRRAVHLPALGAAQRAHLEKNWLGYRYATDPHCDLAEQFTFYSVSGRDGAARRFNLDFYCKAFGIESPKSHGVTGMDVGALLAAGKFRDIAEYCLRDVRATVELYKIWKERLAGIK